jgi:hypothetical protein
MSNSYTTRATQIYEFGNCVGSGPHRVSASAGKAPSY